MTRNKDLFAENQNPFLPDNEFVYSIKFPTNCF